MSLQIIQYPHPTLRHLAKPLKRVDADLRSLVAEMFELMYAHEGVGLAANQVDLPYRLFVANVEGKREAKEAEQVFINPVLSGGRGQHEDEEGCLSIPGIYAPVTRNETIRIEAYDLAGNEIRGGVRRANGSNSAARNRSPRRHAVHRSTGSHATCGLTRQAGRI